MKKVFASFLIFLCWTYQNIAQVQITDTYFSISRNSTNNSQFFTFQDVNNDGYKDAFVFDHPAGTLKLYINNGTTLTLASTITTPQFIKGKLSEYNFVDLDNDGVKDMLISCADHYGCTNNNVRIYWGSAQSPYFSTNNVSTINLSSPFCTDAFAFDYNNDGLKDIFIENVGSGGEMLYKNNGNRSFSSIPTTNTPRDFGGYQTMTIDDYDGDGYKDLLSDANGWATGIWGIYLYRGNGDGTFSTPIINYASQKPNTPVIKLNANPKIDKKIDIAFNASNDGTSGKTLYIGKWSSALNNFAFSTYSLGTGAYTSVNLVQSFDWNGDSYEDLIVCFANSTSYTYKVFINDGEGNFNINQILMENSSYWRFYAYMSENNNAKVALINNDTLVIKNTTVSNSLNQGLVAYYPFNGNANDESGNGYNGVVQGATLTADRFGNSNNAYKFDGISNSVTTNFVPPNNSTISLWFNPELKQVFNAGLFSTYIYTLGIHSYNFYGWYVSFRDVSQTSILWVFGDGNNADTVKYSGSNVWHHLVLQSSNNTVSIFIDGQLKKTMQVATTHAGPIYFGDSKWDDRYFNGVIDDIRIYNRTLDDTEIQALYHEGGWQNSAITLTSPNGGEKWLAGDTDTIKWTNNGVTNVKLEYTTDNGANWVVIVASTPANTGLYAWTVPNAPSTNCQIRISDATNFSIYSISGTFTLSAQIKNGLVGYWNFDSGTANDVSGNGNNASEIYGGVSFVPGKLGLAANFGGVDNPGHIKIPNSLSLQFSNSISIVFWMKFNSYNGIYNSHAIMAKDHDVRGFRIQAYAPNNEFNTGFFNGAYYNSNFGIYSSLPSYQVGEWINVAYVIEGTSGKLYYNGVLDTSVNSNQIDFSEANGLDLYFGKYIDSWYPFNGVLDEVRIFNRAISQSGVIELYGGMVASSLIVTSPTGGENWQVGSVDTIKWSSSGIQSVKISYSVNNGTDWKEIIASTPDSLGKYAWTIPSTPSSQCLVRVSSTNADSAFDVSDSNFTISLPVGAVTWEATLKLIDAGNSSKALTFGMAPGAADGIDLPLGEYSLPPVPPTGNIDARFELPISPVDYSIKDYRIDTLKNAKWNMKFQPGLGGYPVTLTWNSSALPSGYFTLKDIVTGTIVNVDMKAQSSVTITNSAITAVKVEYSKQVCASVPLAAYWNMFAVPVLPAVTSTSALFPLATSPVYSFNNGYTSQTTVTPGKGYWVRYPSAENVQVCGSPASGDVQLAAGWNLIGGYNSVVPVSSLTTLPAGIINSFFFGFKSGYIQAANLEPGKGYWVRAAQAGTINLSVGTAKSGGKSLPQIENSWSKIIVTDKTGNSATLYAAKSGVNISTFELPPVPPAGIFDVRFASQSLVENLGSAAKAISISGAAYPVEIKVEGIDLSVQDNVTGKLVNSVVKSGSSIVIINENINSIEVSANTKPIAYQLLQNYPNPFNPSTMIRFALPENTRVRLAIYNQLGEQVAELVNEQMEAGYHQVTWNAANMSTGVYFYEIKTEKFRSVKKLILMK